MTKPIFLDGHAISADPCLGRGRVSLPEHFKLFRPVDMTPFGGRGPSGVGREGGEWSFDCFGDVKDMAEPQQPFKASFAHQ